MNFYMYRKLRTALKRGEVDVGLVDKNVDYMVNKNWLKLDMLDSSRFTDYDPIPFPKGTAKITDEGKEQYYKTRNKWIFAPITSFFVGLTLALINLFL
ncbi:hypothetical protein M3559_03480 [Staphylococcus equorum]|uniref:hypothetical protein n=1 Tax=Staphylococcus equorum TaxID=246432 RepID=UPI00204008AA|nr:hypothetical protein [Staphylococcus equorum]MCM3071713.1 hypothetical protein [Staphylococcus equorum]